MKENISITRILEISVPALIVFAVSWGIYTTKLNAQEDKIVELETKYDSVLEMKGDIMVMQNDIEYIKKAVDKINNNIK